MSMSASQLQFSVERIDDKRIVNGKVSTITSIFIRDTGVHACKFLDGILFKMERLPTQ